MAYRTNPYKYVGDPIGPGTPAWEAADLALAAYAKVPAGCHNQNPDNPYRRYYKQYANFRTQMINALIRDCPASRDAREVVREWTAHLRSCIEQQDFD